jgi:hypothetical protein
MAVNSFNAQNPPVTTKGDVFTFSTIPTRLGVGANDTVLTADSTAATGLKWASPLPSQTGNSGKYLTTNGSTASWGTVSGGGFTELSNTSLSGSSTTISSLSSSYKHLFVVVNNIYTNNNDYPLEIRFNSDTGSNYNYYGYYAYQGTGVGEWGSSGATTFQPRSKTRNASSANLNAQFNMWIYNYTNTAVKQVRAEIYSADSGGNKMHSSVTGSYTGSSAVSSITFTNTSGSVSSWSGSVYIYGVS